MPIQNDATRRTLITALFCSPIRGWCENASRQSAGASARQILSEVKRTTARDPNGLRANIPDTHLDAPQQSESSLLAAVSGIESSSATLNSTLASTGNATEQPQPRDPAVGIDIEPNVRRRCG